MERIDLKGGVSLSRIILGMWRLTDYGDSSEQAVIGRVEAALDQGITTIDQADIYGGYMAEEVFGNALRAAPSLRERIEIVSKCDIIAPVGRHADKPLKYYDTSRAHIEESVEHSLRLMNTDRIDLLLIHRPDPLMDHHETGGALDDLVASGKVRAVGVSNFRPHDWKLLQSAMKTPLSTNQIEISLAEIAPFTNGDLAFHQEHGHPLMAWSPLGGGSVMKDSGQVQDRLDQLAAKHGVDRGAIAIAFLLRHPATIMPVMGTNSLERIKSLSAAMSVMLERQEWFALYEAALGHEVA